MDWCRHELCKIGADVSINNCHSLLKPHYTGNTSSTCTHSVLSNSRDQIRHFVIQSFPARLHIVIVMTAIVQLLTTAITLIAVYGIPSDAALNGGE